MYHHVSSGLSGIPPGFVVAPETFEQQMAYLHEAGFYSTDLETWAEAAASKRPLPGRAVVLTFDDGYQDFADCAWPILDGYGFRAIVLLITDAVGGEYALDFARDHPSRLMGWNTILDLRDGGVAFGSHSTSHRPLTGLSPAEVVRDAARSRAVLARALGHDVSCFAYPYGDSDAVVQHLVGAAGFRFGLGTRPGLNGPADPLLQLRRVEVSGLDSMGRFIARLAGSP
jgi:peptidoglycan/xylan/chitin deacetylase (PgdA/CDA1 family)